MTHMDGPTCPGCETKLLQAHPFLADWFRNKVKPRYPNAHISWSYRDEASQEQAFSDGKSKLHYPESQHNHTENGKPMSYALDLFEQFDGKASWDPHFYVQIANDIEAEGLPLYWGGRWKSLGDIDHVGYRAPLTQAPKQATIEGQS